VIELHVGCEICESAAMSFRACLLPVAAALVLLLGACGDSKTETTATTRAVARETLTETVLVRAYFVHGGKMAATGRKTVHTLFVGQESLRALLNGPNAAERRIGFTTALPESVQLRKLTKKSDRLTVRLSRNLNRVARAQVVTTLTQYPSVHEVVIVTPAGSTRALKRSSFEALMPTVLVESPLPFAQVKSPLRVGGSSNTFEATSQLELLDANGKLLVSKTVTASSGTGTRGTFSVNLRFHAPVGSATLVSYEESAKDGSRIHAVRIPLRISR
jgi:hypothetical protein